MPNDLETRLALSDDARAQQRDRLISVIERRSLLRGTDIKLASGGTSTFYFDMKRTAFDPEGAALIGTLLLDRMAGLPVDYVGGLEVGAIPIVACVAQCSFPARPVKGFFVRKQPKDHGTRRLIEGLTDDESLDGKNVVLLEDVTTTGGSAQKAVDAVRAEGGRVAHVMTVVDRLQGAGDFFAAHDITLSALVTVDDFKV